MDQTKRLQGVLLSCTKEICNICKENNIPYFMAGGTQLGAIRHKGFIPWDDDLDIGIKRADYERFIEVCKTDLDSNKYFLQTQDSEEYYAMAFAKIQLKETEIVEEFGKNVPISHGIFVDIFPYDNIPDNILARRIFLFISHILKNMLWIRCGYGTQKHKSKLQYKILNPISKLFSIKKLKKMQYKWITRYNKKTTQKCFPCDYPKQQLCNEWVSDLVEYPFEDTKFLGIKKYDEYLSLLYGNYMKLPPVEKRQVHTHYKIDFGKY